MPIPKVIHYCWFGGNPKPKLAEKCLASWKKYCPDYEIIEWNESNFDVNFNQYCKEAYEAKKWAFVTDVARLKILYENGGFYFDTDVELLKNLDFLTENDCFMGIENSTRCLKVNTGVGMGAEKGFPLLKEMLDDYARKSFYYEDGTENIITCTERNTEILKKHGYIEENKLQHIAGAVIYPTEYFSPLEMGSGLMRNKTKNTYSIHHYSLSWTSEEHQKERQKRIKEQQKKELKYNLSVLPQNMAKKLLGDSRYENLKGKIKK